MIRTLALILSFVSTNAIMADERADTFAKARITLLEERVTFYQQVVQCRKDFREDYDGSSNCIEALGEERSDTYTIPDALGQEIAALIQPDMAQLEADCKEEHGDDAHAAILANCRAAALGKHFQTIALIRQGIVPESYFDPEYSQSASAEYTDRIEELDEEINALTKQYRQSLLFKFDGMSCRAEAQSNPLGEAGDCRTTHDLRILGLQFCKSISETENGSRGNVENRWGYVYFDDQTFSDGETKKVAGRYADIHAIGGPWTDRYSSNAKVQAVLMFTDMENGRDELAALGCYVPPLASSIPPAPEPDITDELPPAAGMNFTLSARRSSTSTHSGTVTIEGTGTPPDTIVYQVEALREGKWYLVATTSLKFTKAPIIQNIDYVRVDSEAWRVSRLN